MSNATAPTLHRNTIRATARRALKAPQYVRNQADAHAVESRLHEHHRVRAEVLPAPEFSELMGHAFPHTDGFVVRVNG